MPKQCNQNIVRNWHDRKDAVETIMNEKILMVVERKGISLVFGLLGHDLVIGAVIDYMHKVHLGVFKTLMPYWFDGSIKGKPFS